MYTLYSSEANKGLFRWLVLGVINNWLIGKTWPLLVSVILGVVFKLHS